MQGGVNLTKLSERINLFEAMPGRVAQMLLALVLVFLTDGTRAYSEALLSLPHLNCRGSTKSFISTLAGYGKGNTRKDSKASKKYLDLMGFSASIFSYPASAKTFSNRQALISLQQAGTRARGATNMAGKDGLTLEGLAMVLAKLRSYYQNTTTLPQETLRRNLHARRLDNLHLHRCSIAPSSIRGAGQGLFADRDIEAGELITCYPGDAVLCWQYADHSAQYNSEAQVYHSSHIASTEANALRFVNDLHSYELPASQTLSVLGDPLLLDDAAYLGHMANDGASAGQFSENEGEVGGLFDMMHEEEEKYNMDSAARVNAEHMSLEGCHMVTRALTHICEGDEIFVTYGYRYWLSQIRSSRYVSYGDSEEG